MQTVYPSISPRHQRGAFSVLAAASIVLLLLCMVLTLDSGRLYLEKRRLQKVADTAALESLSRLPDGNCAAAPDQAQAFAVENARRNQFAPNDTQSVSATCVRVNSDDGIRSASADASGRAVQVVASKRLATSLLMQGANLLGSDPARELTLSASAIARRPAPVAAFSVGSQLARLNADSLVVSLLRAVGVDLQDLRLLDSNGLANASLSTSGLLRQLGVDANVHALRALTAEELIQVSNTQVGPLNLNQLLAAVTPLVNDAELRLDLAELEDALGSTLEDSTFALLGAPGDQALLTLGLGQNDPVDAAVDAQVLLSDLLGVALMNAVQGRGLHVSALNLASLGDAELGVVEPPSVGIGPVGTTAYTGQIRLYLDIDTDNLDSSALGWLTQDVLGTRVQLPLWIDLISAQATLTGLSCEATPPTADTRVDAALLNMCVGALDDDLKWSTSAACQTQLQDTQLVTLLNQPVLSGQLHLAGLSDSEQLNGLVAGEQRSTQSNPLTLGNTVDDLLNALLDLAAGLFRAPQGVAGEQTDYTGSSDTSKTQQLARRYLEATSELGLYDADAVTDLILNGSDTLGSDGAPLLPPLVAEDWTINNSLPVSCLVTLCPSSSWNDGRFSEAFSAYSRPGSLLDLVGVSTLDNGYRSCGGLLSALLAWNSCLEHNLTKFLLEKPGGIDLTSALDNDALAGTGRDDVDCSGVLCTLLQPMLNQLKPGLNAVGELLETTLSETVGVELGRTDVTLDAIHCGQVELVR